MSQCSKCKHKEDRCFCPDDKECVKFVREEQKMKHYYRLETPEDWQPGHGACWTDCPFSFLIDLGNSCKAVRPETKYKCPFLSMEI